MRNRQPRQDLSGQRFGRLTVASWAGNSKWNCVCDCGGSVAVFTANLKRGNTSSCGCVRNAASSKRATVHGLSGTYAYKSWLSIRRRCRDRRDKMYSSYGGAGIDICDEWFESVEAFVRDVGQPPTPDHTADRIDNSKGYVPGNVRWATPKEQARNRSICRPIEFQGHRFPSISAFCEWLSPQVGIDGKAIYDEMARPSSVRHKPR